MNDLRISLAIEILLNCSTRLSKEQIENIDVTTIEQVMFEHGYEWDEVDEEWMVIE